MSKEDFWNWFDSYKNTLEKLFDGKPDEYNIYATLSDNLKQYSELLIPELTKKENNHFVLVISCDGVITGIPYVESLVDTAKQFDNWTVQKYREADPEEVITISGLSLKRSKILLAWNKKPSTNYHVTFYIKGYSSKDLRYKAGTVIHLQQTVGELNAMTRIEGVEFKRLSMLQATKKLKTLDELKTEIDSSFS